ncbi:DUF1236 domain-containing protein [Ensifer sp. MPMI2T]|nr:DUF1236 domain-containing protein [Ensifer sp. MPMI2T]
MKGILIKSAIALGLGVTYVPALAQTEQPAQGQSAECPAGTECPQGGAQGQQPEQPQGEGTGQQGQPMEEQQPGAEQGGTGQQQQQDQQPQPDTGTPEQQQQDQVAPEAEQPDQPDTEQQPPEGQTDQQQDQGQTEQPQGETGQDESQQGQATGGGDVNVTVEQKTEITQIVKEENVEPVDVDFNVTVGAAVPETVELRPLPQRIVKIVPQYEGYRFFVLADGRIVIVEPSSLKIIVILA